MSFKEKVLLQNKKVKNLFLLIFSVSLLLIATGLCYGTVEFIGSAPSSDGIYGDIVVSTITVRGYEALTDTVSYRIAAEENGWPLFGPWHYGAVEVPSAAGESVFRADIPGGLPPEQRFSPGESNFIQWRVKRGTNSWVSDRYRIVIFPQKLEIIQPGKGVASSRDPLFEARVTEELRETELKGATMTIRGGDINKSFFYPNDLKFDYLSGIISFRKGQNFIRSGEEYSVEWIVRDGRYMDPIKTSFLFTSGKDMVSDFINYPNPFDNRRNYTTFRYVLKEEARISINIYDTSRSLVKSLVKNERRPAGINEEVWDGRHFSGSLLANGVYFCEIITGSGSYKRYTIATVYAQ